jgi:hypothetical protein
MEADIRGTTDRGARFSPLPEPIFRAKISGTNDQVVVLVNR